MQVCLTRMPQDAIELDRDRISWSRSTTEGSQLLSRNSILIRLYRDRKSTYINALRSNILNGNVKARLGPVSAYSTCTVHASLEILIRSLDVRCSLSHDYWSSVVRVDLRVPKQTEMNQASNIASWHQKGRNSLLFVTKRVQCTRIMQLEPHCSNWVVEALLT